MHFLRNKRPIHNGLHISLNVYAEMDIRACLYYGIPLPRVGTFDTGLNAVLFYVVLISTRLVPIHCDYIKFRLLFTNLEATPLRDLY